LGGKNKVKEKEKNDIMKVKGFPKEIIGQGTRK
jgi:hypothetical protein